MRGCVPLLSGVGAGSCLRGLRAPILVNYAQNCRAKQCCVMNAANSIPCKTMRPGHRAECTVSYNINVRTQRNIFHKVIISSRRRRRRVAKTISSRAQQNNCVIVMLRDYAVSAAVLSLPLSHYLHLSMLLTCVHPHLTLFILIN